MKLSVIIPVFNCEDTLIATLDSIAVQEFTDFEVILVNDGSSDSSQDIIERYCALDSRFRYYAQQNSGVSVARNLGLAHASGEFVTFVDGDDLLPKKSFYHMAQITRIHDCDTVVGAYERTDGMTVTTNARSLRIVKKSGRIHPNDVDLPHCWSLWNKWLSRRVIEDNALRFENYRHLEDGVFLYSYLRFADKIYTCPNVVYTYRKPLPFMGRTTTQSVDKSLLDSAEAAFERICNLTAEYGEHFYQELVYRYLLNPMLGDYYRRYWQLSDACTERLLEIFESRILELDKPHRESINKKIIDVLSVHGIASGEDILACPLVAIAIELSPCSQEYLEIFLESLYDQAEPSFVLYVPKSFEGCISDYYSNKRNLRFVSAPIEEAYSSNAQYVLPIEESVIFDHATLFNAAKALQDDHDAAYVKIPVKEKLKNNTVGKGTDLGEHASLKLFRRKSSSYALDEASCPVVEKSPFLSFAFCLELMGRQEHVAKDNGQTNNLDKRLKHGLRRLFRVSKRIFGFEKRQEKVEQDHTPKPRSTVSFYLNEDIDFNAVVIEGLGKIPRGNTLYLAIELSKKKYGDLNLYFSVREDTQNDAEKIFASRGLANIKTVVAGSQEYKRLLFSARYLFNEVDFPNWWIKKPGQVYINIWHGTPMKKLAASKPLEVHQDALGSHNFPMTDYLLFPNEHTKEAILRDYNVEGLVNAKALMVGYPRTGCLFDSRMRDKVRATVPQKNVFAWMPTWRDSFSAEDAEGFLSEIDALLNDDQVLYVNLHHKTSLQIDYSELSHVRQFPNDFDTYEFLCGIDALIADYSSVIFDYSVTGRPIVLYTPDQEIYQHERGLYWPLEELPFPKTLSAKEVVERLDMGKTYCDEEFSREFTAFDDIHNVEKLCAAVILGDEERIVVEQLGPVSAETIMIVSDELEPSAETTFLEELKKAGQLRDNIFLSFTEKGAESNKDTIYPLVRDIPLYATKGKPMNEWTERMRLYGNLPLGKIVVLDSVDPKRIRCFARFDVPTYLFVTQRMLEIIESEEDNTLLKAVRSFVSWGNGIYSLDGKVAKGAERLLHCPVNIVRDIDMFAKEFLR